MSLAAVISVTHLQAFDFCRRSFSRNFINHVPDLLEGGSAVYRGNKVVPQLTSQAQMLQ